MKVRIERADEVAATYEIDDISTDDHGNLSLWKYMFKPNLEQGNEARALVAMINSGSWTALFVVEHEAEALAHGMY